MMTCFSAASVCAAMLCSAMARYIQSAALKRRTKCSLLLDDERREQHGQDHRRQHHLQPSRGQQSEPGRLRQQDQAELAGRA